MINILIKESDDLYHHGMRLFLTDLFKVFFSQDVHFLNAYNEVNIALADVIILSLCQGERYTCFPELQARRKGIIVGLVDDEERPEHSPSCFADILYMQRGSSLEAFTNKVFTAWQRWSMQPQFTPCTSCIRCRVRQMSQQQLRIMVHFYRGVSVKSIASYLGMSSKTVFTHKYLVMHKFNLHNDIELLTFLDRLAEKNSPTLSFKRMLN